MDAGEAEAYHSGQITSFAESGADMVTAVTLTSINEAVGIVRAAERQKIPCAISFTVETNGRLVKGETLQQAIETVDHETKRISRVFQDQLRPSGALRSSVGQEGGLDQAHLRHQSQCPSMRSHSELNASKSARRRQSAGSQQSLS